MGCTLQKCCTFLAACVFDVLITVCWCPETPFAPPGPHTACCCWRVCCLWLPLRRRLRALLLRLHAVRLRPGCECHHGCGSDATSIVAAAVAVASGAAAVASMHRCGCGPLSRRPSLILCNNRCCHCCCCCTLLFKREKVA